MQNKLKIVFFGTPKLAEVVLEEMRNAELTPELIVTAPDKPAGRGMKLRSPFVKEWADKHDIPTLQPEKIDEEFLTELRRILAQPKSGTLNSQLSTLNSTNSALSVVFAYGKILPQALLDIPTHGTLNLHPSLLPKLRGPSPMRSAILEDEKETGVTVMLMDEKMDHGPILAQEEVTFQEWPSALEVEDTLMQKGAKLLAQTIPEYLAGKITPQAQDDTKATYCKLFKKEDALLDLNDDPYQNYLKFLAYAGWPGAHFIQDGVNIKITEAQFNNGIFEIKKVIPEGGKEQSYNP